MGLVVAAVGGCALAPASVPPTQPPSPPPMLAVVDTPDGQIGLARGDGGSMSLYEVRPDGSNELTHKFESGGTPTVHMVSFGGQTGGGANPIVFGSAPPGTAQVQLADGPVVGSSLESGVYVVVLAVPDLRPDLLRWSFLAGDGSVIAQGTGLRD